MQPGLDQASLNERERGTVERLVELLSEELGADLRAVWLYGSRARGERPSPESDVDLLIIAEGGWDRYERRAIELMFQAADEQEIAPTWFSIKTFGPEWVEDRRSIRSFFIQEVDRDKIVLFGEP